MTTTACSGTMTGQLSGQVTMECACCKTCHRTLEFRVSDCDGSPLDDFLQNKADVLAMYGPYSIASWDAFLIESVGTDTWLQVINVVVECDRPDDPPCNGNQI